MFEDRKEGNQKTKDLSTMAELIVSGSQLGIISRNHLRICCHYCYVKLENSFAFPHRSFIFFLRKMMKDISEARTFPRNGNLL